MYLQATANRVRKQTIAAKTITETSNIDSGSPSRLRLFIDISSNLKISTGVLPPQQNLRRTLEDDGAATNPRASVASCPDESPGAESVHLSASEELNTTLVSFVLGLMCRKRKQSSEPSLSHLTQTATTVLPIQYQTPSRTRALSPPSCRPR